MVSRKIFLVRHRLTAVEIYEKNSNFGELLHTIEEAEYNYRNFYYSPHFMRKKKKKKHLNCGMISSIVAFLTFSILASYTDVLN